MQTYIDAGAAEYFLFNHSKDSWQVIRKRNWGHKEKPPTFEVMENRDLSGIILDGYVILSDRVAEMMPNSSQ